MRLVAGGVNIPIDELLDRLAELPPKSGPLRIADTGEEAARAADILRAGGRVVELVPFEWADGPQRLRLWRPVVFLEDTLPHLHLGRALDLGCGSGREAVAMAAFGFSMTAIDNLPDALAKGHDLAQRYTPEATQNIKWTCRNLDKHPPFDFGRFDLVTMFSYLDREIIRRATDLLEPGGSLLVETFTEVHRERFGKPRSDAHILKPGELRQLAGELQIKHYSEGWRTSGRHTARLWATRGQV